MERKTIMGLAAVAGIGLLLYMRRNADASGVTAAANTLNGASYAGTWGASPATVAATTKPATVDAAVANTKPAQVVAPQPVGSGASSVFVGVGSDAPAADVAYWLWSDVGQGKNGIPITDAAKVAELDGVRAFATQYDLLSDSGTQTVFDAAKGQGLSYMDTLQTLGSAFKLTDREVRDHAAKYGVTAW